MVRILFILNKGCCVVRLEWFSRIVFFYIVWFGIILFMVVYR